MSGAGVLFYGDSAANGVKASSFVEVRTYKGSCPRAQISSYVNACPCSENNPSLGTLRVIHACVGFSVYDSLFAGLKEQGGSG